MGEPLSEDKLDSMRQSYEGNSPFSDMAALIREIDRLRAALREKDEEIARLNKWADSYSDSMLKERKLAEEVIMEFRAKVAALEAQAAADLEAMKAVMRAVCKSGDIGLPEIAMLQARIAARGAKEGT